MPRIVGPNGIPFDCDDDVVASGLLGSASGEYKLADAEPAAGPTAVESPASDEKQESQPETPAGTEDQQPEDPAKDGQPEDPAEPEQPAGNASHEAWVEYALAVGKTPDELDGLSRNAVRDLFKE